MENVDNDDLARDCPYKSLAFRPRSSQIFAIKRNVFLVRDATTLLRNQWLHEMPFFTSIVRPLTTVSCHISPEMEVSKEHSNLELLSTNKCKSETEAPLGR